MYEQLKLDKQLCFTVYACSREIIKLYKPYLYKLNLTYTQYITMLVMWEDEVVSAKDLGSKLYLDSGTLTPLLKKLEKLKLVTRNRSKEDERILMVTLTNKGRALKEVAKVIPKDIVSKMGISVEDLTEIRSSLQELTNHIHTLDDTKVKRLN